MVLFRGRARLLDQELELRTFAYIEIARLVLDDALKHRRTRIVVEPDDGGILGDGIEYAGELVDDRLRRSGWCGEAGPRAHQHVGIAKFDGGWNVGQRGQALFRSDRQRKEFAGLDISLVRREVV